jgi:hypothetical protein
MWRQACAHVWDYHTLPYFGIVTPYSILGLCQSISCFVTLSRFTVFWDSVSLYQVWSVCHVIPCLVTLPRFNIFSYSVTPYQVFSVCHVIPCLATVTFHCILCLCHAMPCSNLCNTIRYFHTLSRYTVGIVRSRTKGHGVCFVLSRYTRFWVSVMLYRILMLSRYDMFWNSVTLYHVLRLSHYTYFDTLSRYPTRGFLSLYITF